MWLRWLVRFIVFVFFMVRRGGIVFRYVGYEFSLFVIVVWLVVSRLRDKSLYVGGLERIDLFFYVLEGRS